MPVVQYTILHDDYLADTRTANRMNVLNTERDQFSVVYTFEALQGAEVNNCIIIYSL